MPIAFAPLNFSVKNSLPCVPPHCPYGHGSENPGVKGYGSINPGVAQQTNLLPHQNFTLREIFHPCVPQHCCLQQHGSENPGVNGIRLSPGLRNTQGREFFSEKFEGAKTFLYTSTWLLVIGYWSTVKSFSWQSLCSMPYALCLLPPFHSLLAIPYW